MTLNEMIDAYAERLKGRPLEEVQVAAEILSEAMALAGLQLLALADPDERTTQALRLVGGGAV